MDPRLAAMQGAMSASPMEGDPAEMEMAPDPAAAPAGDEASAIAQVLEILAPFAENPAILQALQILQESSGSGPTGDVPEDTMPMDEEQAPLA